MTPEQAKWVRKHAWPTPRSAAYARAAAAPDLADEGFGCTCQLRPSHWCRDGQHHRCHVADSNEVPTAWFLHTDGLTPCRYPDGRMVMVWPAGSACRWRCRCDCHRPAHERGLLFDLATA